MELIQSSLDLLEKKLASEFAPYKNIVSELATYASGSKGKRLRPALLFLSGKLFGQIDQRHLNVATAIELIHTATLVHDDIIDEAQIRRKKPSLNKAYGSEVAVMAGDLILSHAMNLLVSLPTTEPAQKVTAVTNSICEGEILQTFRRFKLNITEEEYLEVIEKKTASLFEISCQLGAEFSGASKEQAEHLACYGKNAGIAFQIVDDCLDIVGNEETLGKSLGTDMKKGKLTLPFLRHSDQASDAEKKELDQIVSPPYTVEKMKSLKEILITKGGVEESFNCASDYVQQAKAALDALEEGINAEVFRTMHTFADDILTPLREKFSVIP